MQTGLECSYAAQSSKTTKKGKKNKIALQIRSLIVKW